MPQEKTPLTPEEVKAQQAKLPVWLQLTPAQREEDQALQERLKTAAGPLGHPTREEHLLMRAAALMHHARTQLSDPHHQHNAEAMTQAKRVLAEGLAMSGEYREAADLHPDKEHAAKFAEIADAIESEDVQKCACLPSDVTVNGKTVTLQPRIISEWAFSKRQDKLMPVVRCTQCGNITIGHDSAATTRSAEVAKTMKEAKQ